jgi:hypothetical protein
MSLWFRQKEMQMEMNTAHAMLEFAADPADRLPQTARLKLVAFREAKALAAAGMREVADRIDWQRTRQQEAEQRITSLKRDYGLDPDGHHQSVAEATARRDKAKAEFARLQQIHDERAAAWQVITRLVTNLESWIKGVRSDEKITEYEGPPPLVGRLPPTKAIERYRSELERLRNELEQVECAPIPSAEAKRIARDHVAELARLGKPDVTTLVCADVFGERGIKFQTVGVDVRTIHRAGVGQGEVVNPLALAAWLHSEAMIAKLDAEIDAEANDGRALSDADRERRKTQLRAEILAVERAEELTIVSAEGEGSAIPRRPDADPRAVLNMTEKLPPPQRD